MEEHDDTFILNNVTVNINHACKRHKHMYQSAKNYIFITGDFTGGELIYDKKRHGKG